jgi:integrase
MAITPQTPSRYRHWSFGLLLNPAPILKPAWRSILFRSSPDPTYATRLRQGGADPAQVQALLGHASIETAARYFRAGNAEQAAVVDRVFE